MQPPPQAVPPSVVGPPPAGNPPSMFWSGSSYRRQAAASAPGAAVTGPLQPVTDPFAFSRQALQSTSPGSSSKSSPPVLLGSAPPAFLQHPGLPVPHTNAGDSSQGFHAPLPRPLSQPRPAASPFSSVLTPSAPPGPELNRSAQATSSSEHETQAQYIPEGGSSTSHGGPPHGHLPGPDRPPSGPNPHDGAAAPTASPFFPQPRPQMPGQMPGQWGPAQGSLQPSGHYWPRPEGPVASAAPQASSVSRIPALSSLPQGPAHEQHQLPAPGPSVDGKDGAASMQSGNHAASPFDLENTFRQSVRGGSAGAGQEVRPSPAVSQEHGPNPALGNPSAQGSSLESHLHCPMGAASRALPEADSGTLSLFFRGGEMENEESLSSENTGSAAQSYFDGFSPSPVLGPPPAHAGAGGVYQAFLRASRSETAQQGGDTQPYFPQSAGTQLDQPAAKNAAADVWGDTAGAGTHDAGGSHCENVENLEFAQNQEVLPSEPPNLDASSPGDHLRYAPLPGPPGPRLSVTGHAAGGGSNLEALDAPLHPVRSDSVSSSYSSKSHRSASSTARPQDLGTFIQQEVGKPEEEAPGSFFKQIDSSPVGGETDVTTMSQNYHHSLSQPLTPSPPKPTGVFQTSANSSFEPVRSHLVGVKPVEADRANVVGEVRGSHAHQKHRPAAAPPDACPGNLEQPPDNMETLLPPQVCPLPLPSPAEANHRPPHPGGPPLDTVFATPEKRPSTRAQGAMKCESPATTLWAQNELPDFGGNVLLAPAAPALHVPGKPQPPEVVQPPDKGVSGPRARPPGCLAPLQGGEGIGASENLENPPKMGEEEALLSQASSGYASLLSSPPTESLHSQPVLIAQPDQSAHLAQPLHFPVPLSHPTEKTPSWRDVRVGDRSAGSSRAAGADAGEAAPLPGVPASALTCSPLSHSLAQSNFPHVSALSETVSTPPANLLVQPPSHPAPKNLLPGQKSPSAESALPELVSSPAGSTGLLLVAPASDALGPHSNKADPPWNREETWGALDFTLNGTVEKPARTDSLSHAAGPAAGQQPTPGHPSQPGPGPRNPDHFYQQVTKGAPNQHGPEKARQEPAPPPPGPTAAPFEPSNPESPPAPGQPQNSAQPPASTAPADLGQQPPPRPPQSSSASAVSSSSSQAAVPPGQQWMPPQPLDLASYYYYRPPYDSYQAQYPSPYPPDSGTVPLYQVGLSSDG